MNRKLYIELQMLVILYEFRVKCANDARKNGWQSHLDEIPAENIKLRIEEIEKQVMEKKGSENNAS